ALAFRVADGENFLLLEAYQNNLQFYRRKGGVWMLLASEPIGIVTPGSTHRIEVRAVGSTLQGYWDGILKVESTSTFLQTTTKHGLDWNNAFDPSSTYDNFTLLNATPTPVGVTHLSISPDPVMLMVTSSQAVSAQALDAADAP